MNGWRWLIYTLIAGGVVIGFPARDVGEILSNNGKLLMKAYINNFWVGEW